MDRLQRIPVLLIPFHGVFDSAMWELLSLTVPTAACRQPRWHQQGSSGDLMASLRFCVVLEAACALLLGFKQAIEYGTIYCSIASIICLAVALQVRRSSQLPLSWYLKLVVPQLVKGMDFSRSALLALSDTGSDVCFPFCLFQWPAEHVLDMRTHAPEHGSPCCVQLPSSRLPHASETPASQADDCKLHSWRCNLVGSQKAAGSCILATRSTEPTGAAASGSCLWDLSVFMSAAGMTSESNSNNKQIPYKSKASTKVLSIKLHDHGAYDHRERIAALVAEKIRQAYLFNHKSNYGCNEESSKGRSKGRLVSLKIATWPGCLQLLVEIVEENAPSGTGSTTSSFTAEELGQLLAPMLADMKLRIHVVHSSGDNLSLIAGHTPGQHPVPSQNSSEIQAAAGQPPAIRISPFVAEAHSQHESSSTVSIIPSPADAVSATVQDQNIPQLEAVARFLCDGQEIVQKQTVDTSSCLVRLHLPRNITPGPFSVHIFSCEPGCTGLLLGSISSVALPSLAFQEMQQLLQNRAHDASIQSGFGELLQDMAIVWSMDTDVGSLSASEQASSSTAWELAKNLLVFFEENEMQECYAAHVELCKRLFQSSQHCRSNTAATPTAPGADPDTDPDPEAHAPGDGASSSDRLAASALPPALPASAVDLHQLPQHCRVQDAILGFADKNLEAMYVEFRGGAHSRKADSMCLGWFSILIVLTHIRRAKMFVRWSLWYAASLMPCVVAYALLASPLRARLGSRRCTIIGIARMLGSWIHAHTNVQGWAVGDPRTLKEMTDSLFDLMFCLQFPLVTQTRFTFWVLAAAAGEVVAEAVSFAPVIGYKASIARMLAAHVVGVLGVVKIDMWTRNAFLKGINSRAKKAE